MTRLHLKIYGRVQGVGFRAAAACNAEELRLRGWVQNCGDSCVETEVEGDAQRIECYRDWCLHGPQGARVERIEEQWQDASAEFSIFEIR